MIGGSYKIARIWGIPVKIHVSLLLLLVFMGLYAGFSVSLEQGLLQGLIALISNVLMLLLVFVSVGLHELGHSFVAIRKGCRVRQITLMFIGGAAQMERIPTRPRDEILMAVAGPMVSLAIGTTIMIIAFWLRRMGVGMLHELMFILGGLNLVLAAFNLMPAFPMDGGRILRAALTGRVGRLQATRIASQIGRILAFLMGLFGLMNGQWFLVAVAFFIYVAAGAEYSMLQSQEAFRSRHRPFDAFKERFTPDTDFLSTEEDANHDDDGDEAVIVSPPPYSKGPVERIDIHREAQENRNRFRVL